MRFQYCVDDNGIVSNVRHILYPLGTMGADREWYFEGCVKEIKISEDKKSFTVVTEKSGFSNE